MTLEHSIARIDTELEKIKERLDKLEAKPHPISVINSPLQYYNCTCNINPNTDRFSMCGCNISPDLSNEVIDKSIQQILDYNDSNSRTD